VSDQLEPRSRRAILAAALGGTGALVAASAALPLSVAAADPNDVARDTDNETTAVTSITQTTADTGAFEGHGKGDGPGVVGSTDTTVRAGVAGLSGGIDGSGWADAAPDVFGVDAGVYGFADHTDISGGVWGESLGGIGVLGTGALGVFAFGLDALQAVADGGTAVQGHAGPGDPPVPPDYPVALLGTVTTNAQVGLEARGRVRFPNRSGRATIAAGRSSVTVNVSGVTSGNIVFAVLNGGGGGGRWVRAAVPYAGKIAIYLNGAVTTSTAVAWLVLG
jgi:hypothetical protein